MTVLPITCRVCPYDLRTLGGRRDRTRAIGLEALPDGDRMMRANRSKMAATWSYCNAGVRSCGDGTGPYWPSLGPDWRKLGPIRASFAGSVRPLPERGPCPSHSARLRLRIGQTSELNQHGLDLSGCSATRPPATVTRCAGTCAGYAGPAVAGDLSAGARGRRGQVRRASADSRVSVPSRVTFARLRVRLLLVPHNRWAVLELS